MKVYKENAVREYLTDERTRGIVQGVKVTSVKTGNFNDMEGYSYIANIQLTGINGRKKYIKLYFNSTYLEEYQEPKDWADSFLEGLGW